MKDLKSIDLKQLVSSVKAEGKGRRVLWQDSESIAFLSSGRKERTDFHVDPSDEVTLQLTGEQHLHYITPEGEQRVAVIRAGEMLLCPAGVPHSPRLLDDSWFIVFERKRRAGEKDQFLWYCEKCGAQVSQVEAEVGDYSDDPVGRVRRRFAEDASLRTCKSCGSVIPPPPSP